jgi:hypothetical protein
MKFLTARLSAAGAALGAFAIQAALLLDQAGNVLLGVKAVLLAALTGEEQGTCYADETLSAHAWRADVARKPWGRMMRPVIDLAWSWQRPDQRVNAAAGFEVTGHCERAFWKKRLRLGLPPEYRDA